jgi:ribosomal protein L13
VASSTLALDLVHCRSSGHTLDRRPRRAVRAAVKRVLPAPDERGAAQASKTSGPS